MSKIIPIFYLPKEYPEDMSILAKGLVVNNGQTLKNALYWLEGKLVTHKVNKGKPAGTPMSATTIKNYLAGFYVLDLYKADGYIYSETNTKKTKASISVQSTIKVINSLQDISHNLPSIEVFNENLTQICSQYSQLVKDYTNARFQLHEKHQLSENPEAALLQKLLIQHCGYSYVGNPGVGYLDLFYREKIEIDSYLKLLEFIVKNYASLAKKTLGLVPLSQIFTHLKLVANYTEKDFNTHLNQLRLTHRVELITTKAQLAQNIGIDLVEISGIKYGFVKVIQPALAS
ncbi:hypothetical protein CK516_09975 [Nostoc sp. 'Peltigera malacea cyanobiont' DB3992]|nr:hypothetical protein CK516_09975 [Nostoc sp. 'Peltigera malacea cyanobiont' DB3992]